jgi:hypothetical protein
MRVNRGGTDGGTSDQGDGSGGMSAPSGRSSGPGGGSSGNADVTGTKDVAEE